MNIQKVSNLSFNALILQPAIVQNAPIPAIIRTVTAAKQEAAPIADTFIKSSPMRHIPMRRFSYPHEAVVTDPKVRVVGLDRAKEIPHFPNRNLKGEGRKTTHQVWKRR